MEKKAYEEAEKEAVAKVLMDISVSGSPTKEQLDFLKMMKPKQSEFEQAKEIGSFFMSLVGFMEGK